MTNPIWPNVNRSQYLKERWVGEQQSADIVIKLTRRGDRVAALVVMSQTYAVTDPSIADLIAAIWAGITLF